MMKKSIMILGLLLSCGIASLQAQGGTFNAPDSIKTIHACLRTNVTLNAIYENCFWYDSTGDTIHNPGTTTPYIGKTYSFIFNGDDTIFYAKRHTSAINSTVTRFIVTLPPNHHDTATIVACQTYSWRGHTYNYTNTAAVNIRNGKKLIVDYDTTTSLCGDTTFHYLNLTLIGPKTYNNVNKCDSYRWLNPDSTYITPDSTYTESGSYTRERRVQLPDGNYCALYDTLNLTINNKSISYGTDTLDCNITSYSWTDPYNQHRTFYFRNDTTIHGIQEKLGTTTKGCDSIQELTLIFRFHKYFAETHVNCDSFYWNGKDRTYTESNNTDTIQATMDNGCKQITTLNLIINRSSHNNDTITRCDSYTWDSTNTTYYESNTCIHNYINNDGCASTDTLFLTINKSTSATVDTTACDQFTWRDANEETYDNSIYTPTYTLRNSNGCDSIITLHLTINHSSSRDTAITACDSYTWFGKTYKESNTAKDTLFNSKGCDSIITLRLTINYGTHDTISQERCDFFVWHNSTYRESGTYTYSYDNAFGCSSTDTLHLTITRPKGTHTQKTECEQYVHNGTTYKSSTVIYDTTNIENEGCQQIDTITLTILNIAVPSVQELVEKKTPHMLIYPIKDAERNEEYHFQWYRDNNEIRNENNQYYIFNEDDVFYDTIKVKVWNKVEMCNSESSTEIKRNISEDTTIISISPNPTTGRFTATLLSQDEQAVGACLFNAYGTKVDAVPIDGNTAVFNNHLTPGVYMVTITTKSGKTFTNKIIVK